MQRCGNALMSRIRGGDVTVLGYGVSGRPLVDWLLSHRARSVTVRDGRTPEQMEADGDTARLATLGVRLICGKHYLAGLSSHAGDVLFRTPGMRPDKPELRAAMAAGALLSSEMELFLALTPATVIAITGSDGKTTTTTLTARILEAACARRGKGRVYLGGNIGSPLLPLVDEMTANDFAVVELSSFQLITLPPPCAPDRAAITNITPNHLNWHPDMAEYIAAKTRILGGGDCTPTLAVLNARDDHSVALAERLSGPITWFSGAYDLPADYRPDTLRMARGDCAAFVHGDSICLSDGDTLTPILPVARIRLPGRHNVENYMTAIALTCIPADGKALAEPEDVCAVADAFTGVPHRLELVHETRDIRFYNSSIDSSPTRSVAALHAMKELNTRGGETRPDPIVICGGQDKGVAFDPLAEALCRYASHVVLTGEARDQIFAALRACPDYDPDRLPVTVIPDWDEAMHTACAMATPGDTVLLSPACTSFDAFRNFEERGEVFRRIARGIE